MEERQRRERMWRRTEVYWHGAQSRSSLRPFSSTDCYICQCSIWFLFLSSLRLLLWIATVSSHILSLESILLSSLSLSFSYPCFPFAFGRVLLYRLSQYQVRDVWSRFNSDTNALVLREETNYIPCKKRRMQTCFLERSRRGEDLTCRFVAWRLVCNCAALQKTMASSIVAEFWDAASLCRLRCRRGSQQHPFRDSVKSCCSTGIWQMIWHHHFLFLSCATM